MYNLYSEFDIESHRKTFINYLEIIITEDGKIVYAVPSHIEKASEITCKKLGITKKQLMDECPIEYYGAYDYWVMSQCNCIMVWNDFYKMGENGINESQIKQLKRLKISGLYRGTIGDYANKKS